MILPLITDHCSLGTFSTTDVKKEQRGHMAAATAGKPEYTEAEKNACSLDAMPNGGACEAYQ